MATHKFFAYLARLRWIKRWGLKRNVVEENVMEHSWQVATIAHCLAEIGNQFFSKQYDSNLCAVLGLYHDASEILTGDLPTPVKYHSPAITDAYRAIETHAEHELLSYLPEGLQGRFQSLIIHDDQHQPERRLVKYADIISAYLKCQQETEAGNKEFRDARQNIEEKIRQIDAAEVNYFMEHFESDYLITLDQLMKTHKS